LLKESLADIGREKFVNWGETPDRKKLFAGNSRQTLFSKKSGEKLFTRSCAEQNQPAAFGGSSAVAVSVPVKNSFSQAGSGCNYPRHFLRDDQRPRLRKRKSCGSRFCKTARGGDQIVHQYDALARQPQTGGERI